VRTRKQYLELGDAIFRGDHPHMAAEGIFCLCFRLAMAHTMRSLGLLTEDRHDRQADGQDLRQRDGDVVGAG
jgi:hypothetical protein